MVLHLNVCVVAAVDDEYVAARGPKEPSKEASRCHGVSCHIAQYVICHIAHYAICHTTLERVIYCSICHISLSRVVRPR